MHFSPWPPSFFSSASGSTHSSEKSIRPSISMGMRKWFKGM